MSFEHTAPAKRGFPIRRATFRTLVGGEWIEETEWQAPQERPIVDIEEEWHYRSSTSLLVLLVGWRQEEEWKILYYRVAGWRLTEEGLFDPDLCVGSLAVLDRPERLGTLLGFLEPTLSADLKALLIWVGILEPSVSGDAASCAPGSNERGGA